MGNFNSLRQGMRTKKQIKRVRKLEKNQMKLEREKETEVLDRLQCKTQILIVMEKDQKRSIVTIDMSKIYIDGKFGRKYMKALAQFYKFIPCSSELRLECRSSEDLYFANKYLLKNTLIKDIYRLELCWFMDPYNDFNIYERNFAKIAQFITKSLFISEMTISSKNLHSILTRTSHISNLSFSRCDIYTSNLSLPTSLAFKIRNLSFFRCLINAQNPESSLKLQNLLRAISKCSLSKSLKYMRLQEVSTSYNPKSIMEEYGLGRIIVDY
ncbi:unnamed protein product [Moneuplotes crassus]|uniref:Uncharacterized protein n=1 Tax=Euplotes crassus TaxID=5936 RepID=A0AAD2D3Q2_EUPCR|nr:unnamed protein product [Moneuplotes crassus]